MASTHTRLKQRAALGFLRLIVVALCFASAFVSPMVAEPDEVEEYLILRSLADLKKCSAETLAVQLMDDTDLLKAALPRLGEFKALRKIRLSQCDVPAGLWKHINDCPKLEYLDVKASNINEKDLGLLELNSLVSLDISRCSKLTPTIFAVASRFGRLEVFKAEGMVFGNAKDLPSLSILRQLVTLSLAGSSDLTDVQLGQLIKGGTIAELNLGYCSALVDLSNEVCSLPGLLKLDVPVCKRLSDKAAFVASKCPLLSSLNICGKNAMTDAGYGALGKCPRLEHLVLIGSDAVTDAAILQWSDLSRLVELDVSRCKQITGSGFSALSKSTTLEILIARDCELLNDAGLKNLETIKSLAKIDVDLCPQVTETALERLEAALPDCQLLPPPGGGPPKGPKQG
jgi:hypothetical protein